MKGFTVYFLFCLFAINTVFADSKAPNYYSTAKQHEANGNLGSAANDYGYAAGQTDNLSRRAEIYCDSVRVFLKSNNYRGAVEQMLQVKHNDPKRVISLLAKYEPQARTALLISVSNNRSFGFPHEGMRNEEISYFHQFFPGRRNTLAEDFFKQGVKEKGTDGEEYFFTLAAQTDNKVAQRVAQFYLGSTSQLPLEQQVPALTKGGKYIQDYNLKQQKANELLQLGKALAVKPGEEARTTVIRQALVALMGQDWVQKNLPETVVYEPGEYFFKIQAGEQIAHWIAYPSGRETNADLASLPGSDYEKRYDDGAIAGMNEIHQGNLSKMKFVAKKSSTIRMTVK